MKTLRVFILGTVQGVFFRNFIEQKAEELNVRGFARNLDDGRIEVVIEGRDEKVNEMVDACREGPAHSDVKSVETHELKHQGFDGFKIMTL